MPGEPHSFAARRLARGSGLRDDEDFSPNAATSSSLVTHASQRRRAFHPCTSTPLSRDSLRVGGEMVLGTPEIRFAGELGMRGPGMLLGTFELVEVMHWRERALQGICDGPHEIPHAPSAPGAIGVAAGNRQDVLRLNSGDIADMGCGSADFPC